MLTATTYSKSVLRAAAGELYLKHADVDYFPSYEIVTAPGPTGMFSADLRTVTEAGVRSVVQAFLAEHHLTSRQTSARGGRERSLATNEEVLCDEALLEGFAE